MRLTRNMHRMTKRRVSEAGFSLVELMIAVAIVAVLAAIAYPSYMRYSIKTNRNAAEACLSEHSNYMERLYTTTLNYGLAPASGSTATTPVTSLPPLDCDGPSQTGKNYLYKFGPTPAAPSTSAYAIQAIPNSTLQNQDTTCGTVWVDQTGARHITGTGTVDQCWR